MRPELAPEVMGISTHALREEGDSSSAIINLFQNVNFYPRPPRGGRRRAVYSDACNMAISTHALREEGDDSIVAVSSVGTQFLPTPSARRATQSRPLR